MASILENLLNIGGQFGAAYAPYEVSAGVMEDIKKIGETFAPAAEALGERAAERAAFTPFAVRTATGGTTQVGAGGGITQQLGAQPQAISAGLLGQAQQMAGATPTTAQSLFQQMQTAQAPEIARQRLALEQRLQAQGRGGVQTAAYGGTPEQLAMEKAIQEQQSQNLLTAMQQAPALQGQSLANIQAALTGAYTPQQQELAALTPAAQLANIAQSAGLGQAESLYKAGIGGLQAQAEAQSAVGALEAQRARSLADALTGLFAAEAGQTSPWEDLLRELFPTESSTTPTGLSANMLQNYLDAGYSMDDLQFLGLLS